MACPFDVDTMDVPNAKTPENMRTKKQREQEGFSALGAQAKDRPKLSHGHPLALSSITPVILDHDTEFKPSNPQAACGLDAARQRSAGVVGGGGNSRAHEQPYGNGKQLGGDVVDGEEESGFVGGEGDITGKEQHRNGGQSSKSDMEIISDDDEPMVEKKKDGIDTVVISDSEDDVEDGMNEKETLKMPESSDRSLFRAKLHQRTAAAVAAPSAAAPVFTNGGSAAHAAQVQSHAQPATKIADDECVRKAKEIFPKRKMDDHFQAHRDGGGQPLKHPKQGAGHAIERSNLKARFDKKAASASPASLACVLPLATSSAVRVPPHLGTNERVRELRQWLKQLKAWLDTDCMTRSQYKFARISIDEELSTAKYK